MRLVALVYMTVLLAATVCAYKIVSLGFLTLPGSTLIYTSSFFIGNIFSEVYGANLSKRLIWESIFCGYLFASLIYFISILPSTNYLQNGAAFYETLGHVLRFTTAGVFGYLLSSFLNIYILTKWKFKMRGRLFWLRSLGASSVSEGVATFTAVLFTFSGMLSMQHMTHLIFSALFFKLIYGVIAVWPASFITFLLKQVENDLVVKPSFNPFKLESDLVITENPLLPE